MIPFLHRIADIFYSRFGNELYKHTFVFPNRRAGVFFQKYLAEIAGKPIFSPTIITIQELFESLSPYRLAERIEMLVTLYDLYVQISKSEESFDDFLYWGEMLLNDFNDVDKHLTDARQLFRNVYDLKSLDGDMSYLSESQKNAIRRFWTNFMPAEGNDTKQKFQETWAVLFELYSLFRAKLHEAGYAYEGMMFREVAERAKKKENIALRSERIVFVGLNALTTSEILLMGYLRDAGIGDFYWDYDSPPVRDEHNKASFWVKENLMRFPSKFPIETPVSASEEGISHHVKETGTKQSEPLKPQIELIGIPSAVGQAKHVTQLLAELIETKQIVDADQAINTAIVLPDESLLLPVLYSIPEEIGKINVTMGYSLSLSSVAGLIEHIAGLQRNFRKQEGETLFYHRFVMSILNHPFIAQCAKEESESVKNHILQNNRVMVTQTELSVHPLLSLIFTTVADWHEIPAYLQGILSFVYQCLTAKKHDETGTETNNHALDLEREFIVQCYKTVTRLHDTLHDAKTMSVETYFRLLKRLLSGISVPFSGEPLSGLQVMGVLETRVIDFENLIILSMNEGVFPLKNSASSFIPYTLRKGFGLPTYEHQDSTYAYHFYRMISRAKRIFMLYDTRAEETQTGEVSRYFYQLKYLYPSYFDIRERVVTYDVSVPEMLPVTVAKTPEVLRKLDAFRARNERSLSASLVNNYIDCPLKFYFTAVEELSKETEVQESVESDVFGSIFHRVMETVYNRYKEIVVTPDALTEIIRNDAYLTEIIEKAFARYYFKDETSARPLQGQHYLIGEVLRSYVKQTLESDKQLTPFEYVSSEFRFNNRYRVGDDLSVNFKGSIDRIDRIGDSYRIVDYKTGKGETDFKDIQQMFDSSKEKRPSQIFQVFVYALFYLMENPEKKVSPAVYYLRSIFKKFDSGITFKKKAIDDISVYLPEFVESFNACLTEIFDPSVPFSQTVNKKKCKWCSFKALCKTSND